MSLDTILMLFVDLLVISAAHVIDWCWYLIYPLGILVGSLPVVCLLSRLAGTDWLGQ